MSTEVTRLLPPRHVTAKYSPKREARSRIIGKEVERFLVHELAR
ncbi:hypothetical protein E2C01_065340 [Portunus trituberculatus]|uniref:Uncharacterized protein n=1 Tax=Portunus trituberculatus TaxID=210409 RepID=A0A5B7HE89_PORTR|nr:hypothetical protein [Portunus trituberculatus]